MAIFNTSVDKIMSALIGTIAELDMLVERKYDEVVEINDKINNLSAKRKQADNEIQRAKSISDKLNSLII